MWPKRLATSSSLAVDLDDAPQDLVATTEEYERQDKFGGLWRGRQEPLRERRLADVINTERGARARKLVRENDRTYIYCRCQHGCKMVVQYRRAWLLDFRGRNSCYSPNLCSLKARALAHGVALFLGTKAVFGVQISGNTEAQIQLLAINQSI